MAVTPSSLAPPDPSGAGTQAWVRRTTADLSAQGSVAYKMPSFAAKVIKSYAWAGSTRVITRIFSFSATIVLARILTPDDFGLMAMAVVLIGFAEHLNQLGISAAIVQKDKIDDQDLATLFYLMLGVNATLLVVTATAAPHIASFYRRPELTTIIPTLSTVFVVSGIRIVPQAVLTKEFEFDKLSKAEIAGSLNGLLVGPALAFMGFGVWSLVAAFLLSELAISAMVWWYRPIRLMGPIEVHRIRRFLEFGLHVTLSRILWYVYTRFDQILIGKVLGASALGIYGMALTLSDVPVTHVTTIANTVSYPAYARLQKDNQQLREHFLAVTRYVAMLSFPALAGLIVVREDFISVILSDRWKPMLSVLTILGLVAMARCIGALIAPLMNAIGRPDLIVLLNTVGVVVFPITFLFAIEWGIIGVAAAWLVLYPTVYAIFLIVNCGRIGLRPRVYAKALTRPFVLAVTMVVVVVGIQSVSPGPGAIRLVGAVAGGMTWCLAFISLSEGEMLSNLKLAIRGENMQ